MDHLDLLPRHRDSASGNESEAGGAGPRMRVECRRRTARNAAAPEGAPWEPAAGGHATSEAIRGPEGPG